MLRYLFDKVINSIECAFFIPLFPLLAISTIQKLIIVKGNSLDDYSSLLIILEILLLILYPLFFSVITKKLASLWYIFTFSIGYSVLSLILAFGLLYQPLLTGKIYTALGWDWSFFSFLIFFPLLLVVNFSYPAIVFLLINKVSLIIINPRKN